MFKHIKPLPVSFSIAPELTNGLAQLFVTALALNKLALISFSNLQVLLGWQAIITALINCGLPTIFENKWIRANAPDRPIIYSEFIYKTFQACFLVVPLALGLSYVYRGDFFVGLLMVIGGASTACTPIWLFYTNRLYQYSLIFSLLPRLFMIGALTLSPNTHDERVVFASLVLGQFIVFFISVYLGSILSGFDIRQIAKYKYFRDGLRIGFNWQCLASILNMIFRPAFVVILDFCATSSMVSFYSIVDKIARAYQGIFNAYLGAKINQYFLRKENVNYIYCLKHIVAASVFIIASGTIVARIIDKNGIFDSLLFLKGFSFWGLAILFGSTSYLLLKVYVFGLGREEIFFTASFAAAIAASFSLFILKASVPVYFSILPIAIAECAQFLVIFILTKR